MNFRPYSYGLKCMYLIKPHKCKVLFSRVAITALMNIKYTWPVSKNSFLILCLFCLIYFHWNQLTQHTSIASVWCISVSTNQASFNRKSYHWSLTWLVFTRTGSACAPLIFSYQLWACTNEECMRGVPSRRKLWHPYTLSGSASASISCRKCAKKCLWQQASLATGPEK